MNHSRTAHALSILALLAAACDDRAPAPCAKASAVMPHDNPRDGGTPSDDCDDGGGHWTRPRAEPQPEPSAEGQTPTPMPLSTPHIVCLACHDLQHQAIVPCGQCHEPQSAVAAGCLR